VIHRPRVAAALFGAALAACAPLPTTAPTAAAPAPAPPAAGAAQPAQPTVSALSASPAASKLSARFIGVLGPRLQHDPPFLGIPYSNFYCLRSFLDRQTGESAHQLYVADSYFGGERDWNAAHDASGNALPFTHIAANEITCDKGCAYEEEFAATLPAAALLASAGGFAVTFTARSGQKMTIDLSSAEIAEQLAAVDSARNGVPPAAAAPPPQ
jgi:hypothetical protein